MEKNPDRDPTCKKNMDLAINHEEFSVPTPEDDGQRTQLRDISQDFYCDEW